jgi:hypothetical protein
MGIVDQMHRCDASHNTTVNVLSELYGGRQNFTFTEMDLKNRYFLQNEIYAIWVVIHGNYSN